MTASVLFFIEELKRKLKQREDMKKNFIDGLEEGTIGPDGKLVSSWGQWVPLDEND